MEQKIHDILYYLEHQLIPDYFYDEEINIIASLNSDHAMFFKIFSDICTQEGLENPYTEKDFACEFFKMDEKGIWLGTRLHFPLPEKTPLCYEMYLFFDNKYQRRGCYTLEFNTSVRKITQETKMPDGRSQRHTTLRKENCGFLCSWTKDHVHNNYGSNFLDQGTDRFYGEAFQIHQHRFED